MLLTTYTLEFRMEFFANECKMLLLCRLLVVGPVLKWLALFIYLFITVPTTCSRPSIEMVGFMYLFIYVFLRVHSPDQTVIYY